MIYPLVNMAVLLFLFSSCKKDDGNDRYYGGWFDSIGYLGFWWSATEDGASNAWYRYMYFNSSSININYDIKETGYSVRCVRD